MLHWTAVNIMLDGNTSRVFPCNVTTNIFYCYTVLVQISCCRDKYRRMDRMGLWQISFVVMTGCKYSVAYIYIYKRIDGWESDKYSFVALFGNTWDVFHSIFLII